ncbi:hypothetical protein LJC68_02285 [Bacteroidales bacterium OttesenSCG-928-B11]|nr:hypothetical protein [Bacteroidales bacterium OttesenSCG-928-B11]MDL2325739.1 hypothetical protein [Bacteroidales bacterium OttesenSCG-928-A14]
MDIIEILFPIVVTILYLFFVGKKKKKEEPVNPQPPYFDYDDEYEEEFSEIPIPVDALEEKKGNPPKIGEYVNYDKIDDTIWEKVVSQREIEKNESYFFDNEQEDNSGISIKIEKIREGIIYSEILKRPYN